MQSKFFILLVAAAIFGANSTVATDLNDLEKGTSGQLNDNPNKGGE